MPFLGLQRSASRLTTVQATMRHSGPQAQPPQLPAGGAGSECSICRQSKSAHPQIPSPKLAHWHGCAPEVGFLRLLLEVEADKLAAQEQRDARAADGVHHQRHKQRRIDAVQDLAEGHQVDDRVQQRHAEAQRGLGELPAVPPTQFLHLFALQRGSWPDSAKELQATACEAHEACIALITQPRTNTLGTTMPACAWKYAGFLWDQIDQNELACSRAWGSKVRL